MNPALVTMQGPGDLDIRDLSNFEAGALILSRITEANPGITWGQLAASVGRDGSGRMSGWLTDITKSVKGAASTVMDAGRSGTSGVMDVVRGGGGVVMDVTRSGNSLIGDAFDGVGDKMADALRAFTDKKVIDGLNSSYESFSSSGGITGAVGGGLFNSWGGGGEEGADGETSEGGGIWDFIVGLGSKAKRAATGTASAQAGDVWAGPLPWVIGFGAVGVLLFLRRGHH